MLIAAFLHTCQIFLSTITIFIPQNYVPITHGFSPAPLVPECHPPTNFHLLEMQTKPELRCNIDDGSEDVDMDFMMEMPLECENGNESVCIT